MATVDEVFAEIKPEDGPQSLEVQSSCDSGYSVYIRGDIFLTRKQTKELRKVLKRALA